MKRELTSYNIFVIAILLIILQNLHAKDKLVIALMAERDVQLRYVELFAESVRTFGGTFRETPIWLYLPEAMVQETLEDKFDNLNVTLKPIDVPQKAVWFNFSRKVYAAARAETAANGNYEILVWLDYDTILLKEPVEFLLPANINLGYRPVTHQNIGLLFNEPLDEFWKKSFELMEIDENKIFSMVTPADGDSIKPYINAGCLSVRPERGIFNNWMTNFEKLYNDERLTEICSQNRQHRTFAHQAALTGVLLNYLTRDECLELTDKINYPVFFKEMFGSKNDFHDLTDVITFRHEAFFAKPIENWQDKLQGPSDKITWIIQKFSE